MPRRTRSTRSFSPAQPEEEPAKPQETACSQSAGGTITNFFKSVLGWGAKKTETTEVTSQEPQDSMKSETSFSTGDALEGDKAGPEDESMECERPAHMEPPPYEDAIVEPPPSDVPISNSQNQRSEEDPTNNNGEDCTPLVEKETKSQNPEIQEGTFEENNPVDPESAEKEGKPGCSANENMELSEKEGKPGCSANENMELSEKEEKPGCSASENMELSEKEEKPRCSASENMELSEMEEKPRYSSSEKAPDNLSDLVADDRGILTNEMIEEEKHLHEESVKEDEKIERQRKELIAGLTEGLREERFKRLQYLLKKSNMYTEYLISRMERQKEEEAKRQERACKRREATQRRREAEQAKSAAQKEGGENPAATSTEALPGVKREARKRKDVLTDSQESSQDSQKSVGSKKGRKRNISKVDGAGDTDIQGSKKQRDALGESKVEDKENLSGMKAAVDGSSSTEAKHSEMNEQGDAVEDEGGVSEEDKLYVGENQLINGERPHCEQPVLFSGGVLRQYQIDGYKWLGMLYENGVNGILADEMGLGKTIQVIALVAHLSNMGVGGPFLIVGPLSTLPNWVSEFERFAPKVPVVLYHGTKEERTTKRRKIRRSHVIRKHIRVQPTVITSYEMAMNDRKYLQNYDWKYLIVDEGHRIKNSKCRLIHELKLYNATHRILLTGTPLQNNLAELWSLLNFLLPEIFDDLGSFEAWFDVDLITGDGSEEKLMADQQRQDVLSMLHQILTPFLLRRLKCDVDLCIPPKREVLVYAPMTVGQGEYYSAVVNKTVLQMIEKKKVVEEKVELTPSGRIARRAAKKVNYKLYLGNEDGSEKTKGDKSLNKDEDDDIEDWVTEVMEMNERRLEKEEKKTAPSSKVTIKMANIMMQLKKCCNHPYLLEYPLDKDGEYLIDQRVVNSSGKMLLVDRMLTELKVRGHKVLLFSQMTKMLDILEDYCVLKKLKYCRLDGSSRVDDRRDQISLFNKDPSVFLFLLSTRAGGLGLNLVSADTVVIFDSDWNPQCDLQAQDRCHRIGQTKPVVIYRLITANTIDQRIVERATAKRRLEKMVIHKGKFKSGIKNFTTSMQPMSPQELLALLNSSDHQGIVKGREGEVISESDLQKLLDRSDLEKMWQKQQKLNNGDDADPGSLSGPVEEVSGIFKVLETESGRLGMGNVGEATQE